MYLFLEYLVQTMVVVYEQMKIYYSVHSRDDMKNIPVHKSYFTVNNINYYFLRIEFVCVLISRTV